MRARALTALAMVAAVPVLFIAATAAPASAHVLKKVGPYQLLIGFGTEPTYAGMENSVFLLLTNAKTARSASPARRVEVSSKNPARLE
jgi:hypothetical protein